MSCFKNTIPSDVADGIRDVIGRKDVVTLKKMIRLERSQGDKTDLKIMILTPYRCQILNVKSPFKLEQDFHFLDLKSLDSPSPDRLVISTSSGKVFFMLMVGTDDADHIIGRIALSIRTVFPNVTLSRIVKASLVPLDRQKLIQAKLNQADMLEPGPCGNFSEMYRCLCDYLNVTAREDVEWDVDTIYLSQDCREINLKDFNLTDLKEVNPILSVLIYNRWFNGLIMKDMKINSEVIEFILKVVRNSHNLYSLTLANLGLKCEFSQRLATCLIENKESRLEVLDLSQNLVEDQGMIQISGALALLKHSSLKRLNFSRTELTPTGINGLCQSLRSSANMAASLTHLDLSWNCLKSHEAEELFNFLSTDNSLTDLNLTSTDCAVEVCVSALSRGCTRHLQNLHLGKNHFYGRKSKDWALPRTFQEFFRITSSLKFVDFSFIKYPPEALGSLFDGLLGNSTVGLQLEINLASCELRSAGCMILQRLLPSSTNITSLDLSDNGFDSDLGDLFNSLQYNRSLKQLKVGRNLTAIKPRLLRGVLEAAVEMIQEEGSCLESFSLADSKIRDIYTFLSCLGSNRSLTSLDVSGNLMGDGGARVLAKSIQINSRLRILSFDRNNLTYVGFLEIARALEKNVTLRHVPYPVHDAVTAIKQHPEKTQSALSRIEDLLRRNARENRGCNEQQFRLQKVVNSTAKQVLDRMAEKVSNTASALELLDAEAAGSDVMITARNLVGDATSSKHLLSDVYGLSMERSSGSASALQQKLREMADGVERMVQQHLKSGTSAMVQNAEAQCSHMFEDIKDELTSTTDRKCELPRGSIRDHIMETAGSEIVNRVSEINLAVATSISDTVTDSLLASLSHCNVLLEEQISKCKQQEEEVQLDRSESPEQLSSIFPEAEEPRQPSTDGDSDSMLPSMRKARAQSIAKRRQRPDDASISKTDVDLKSPKLDPEVDLGVGEEAIERSEEAEDSKSIDDVSDVKTTEIEVEKTEASDIKTSSPEEEQLKISTPDPVSPVKKPEADKKIEDTEQIKAEMDRKPKVKEQNATARKNDVTQPDVGFPESDEASKLDHVTKARPRAPGRRQRTTKRRPPPKEEDDFFKTNVSNVDFSQVPTLEEEEEIKRKERIQEKMASKKMPGMGMGMPLFAPGMVQLKKKEVPTEKSTDEDQSKSDEPTSEKSSPVKRPPGAMGMPGMGMPGMGFGGNMFAEMKLKKLNKKSQENLDVKSPDKAGSSPVERTSPFGRSTLKKRSESGSDVKSPERASPPHNFESKKEEFPIGQSLLRKRSEEALDKPDDPNPNPNPNNNNNNSSRFQMCLGRGRPSTDKPAVPHNKPSLVKDKPTPPSLPVKPKPSMKPSSQKGRHVSESTETKTAGLSSVLSRVASLNQRSAGSGK